VRIEVFVRQLAQFYNSYASRLPLLDRLILLLLFDYSIPHPSNRMEDGAGEGQVGWGGDFDVEGGAGGEEDLLIGAFEDLGIVGEVGEAVFGEELFVGGEEFLEREALGGLGLAEVAAVEGGFDGAVGGAAFEGGGFGEGGEGCGRVGGGVEGGVDDFGRTEGTGGVVDGDKGRSGGKGGEVAEAVEDGLIAFVAAGDEVEAVGRDERGEFAAVWGEAVGGSDDEDRADVGAVGEEGNGAKEDGLTAEIGEEFIRAEARAGASGGEDEGEDVHAGI
jgi:hypothetical protein